MAAGDIRSAIEELNQVTQQNASLVEEIASSSENMMSEAGELSNLIGVFKLSNDTGSDNLGQRKLISSNTVKEKEKNTLPSRKKHRAEKESKQDDDFDFNEDDFEKF